jgi:hypothetical protein
MYIRGGQIRKYMKIKRFPLWNLYAVILTVSIIAHFYKTGKIDIHFDWSEEDGLLKFVLGFVLISSLFFMAGKEYEGMIKERMKFLAMWKTPHYALAEWVNNNLNDYIQHNNTNKDIVVSVLQMRLLAFDKNIEYEHKYKSVAEIGKISELDGLLTAWVDSFKAVQSTPSISNEDEHRAMIHLLTNVCFDENIII